MNVQAWTFVIVGAHNGMATAADWMSAASFISMAGLISFSGYDGSVYLMGWTGGYVLLALLLAPYLRKFGKFTVPDFVGDRYYSQTRPRRRRRSAPSSSPSPTSPGRCAASASSSAASSRSTSSTACDRHGHRVLLRRARRDEGHHLHAGRAVLRADLRLPGARDLHLDPDHRQRRSPSSASAEPTPGIGRTFLLDRLDRAPRGARLRPYTSGAKLDARTSSASRWR